MDAKVHSVMSLFAEPSLATQAESPPSWLTLCDEIFSGIAFTISIAMEFGFTLQNGRPSSMDVSSTEITAGRFFFFYVAVENDVSSKSAAKGSPSSVSL